MVNKITGTYRQGSSGEEVKRIQEMLIAKEYDVGKAGADGIFGKDTLAAVQKYQKDNGLSVDGIVGKDTLESLYSLQPTKPSTSTTTTTPTTPSNSGGTDTSTKTPATTNKPTSVFDPTSDPLIQEASSLLQQHLSNKVGDWTDPYKDKWMGYIEQYENRDPFSYDFNSDALYNQYKDQYVQQGRMAMMDTMGQAQAMTGGYGNSYAQTVGQQAYNQQLNQLNEIMPELYGMAYDRYKQEGQDMLDMYSLYKGMSEQDYNMHQNNLENWYTELNNLTDNYYNAYDRIGGSGNGSTVKTPSISELSTMTTALDAYQKRGQYDKIETQINLWLKNGSISEDMAIYLYEQYGIDPNEKPIDVTVDPDDPVVDLLEEEEKKKNSGGGGGKFSYKAYG